MNKIFEVMKHGSSYYLLFKFHSHIIEYEECTAEFLGITVQQYHNELLQFNGIISNYLTYFDNKEDVERAAEYMESKYGTMLALTKDK